MPRSEAQSNPKATRRERRLAEQAEYQRRYRAEQRRQRAPSRDDVARVTLHWFVTLLVENGDYSGLMKLRGEIVRRLVEQGFNPEKAARRVDDLIERYEDGWTFRLKSGLADAGDQHGADHVRGRQRSAR
ncbi:hypothetical protein [Jiella sp. M17.18]|uniref:hypothetical protein n=1 Tax=Jiella sp. M17.18 TaxID=3234247 RepID=UPI0034DE4044